MTSFRSRILHRTLSRVTGAISAPLSIKEQRTRLDELARRGIRLPRGVTVCGISVNGIHSEWIEPVSMEKERVMLYLHGGGYCICSLDTHRGLVSRLVLASQARALTPAYRLAPEHPFPAALEDALATYRWLLQKGTPPNRIAIGGDSAGGGLALATAVSLRDDNEPLPAALFLLSPWTDLTFSGESMHTRQEVDPIFQSGNRLSYHPPYIGSDSPSNPLISPLLADLRGLPPTIVHVGNDEILLDDSTRLEKKMKAAGVEVEIKVWEGMWHVFQAFAPFAPEGQLSIDEFGVFVKKHIP